MADFDSSLPVRTETDGDVVSKIVGADGTTVVKASADGAGNDAMHVQDVDAEAILTTIDADTGSILTTLTDKTQFTKITDGTDDLAVNADGSLNVVIQDAGVSSTEQHVFGTTVAGVPGADNTVVDITVTGGKTFLLKSVQAAASGKFKATLKTGTPASEVIRAVWFGSTAKGTEALIFPSPIEVVAADKILIIVSNEDKANADVYAYANGNEV